MSQLKIAVIGAGKLGLPMGVYMSITVPNNQVLLIDKDRDRVAQINSGTLPFFDVSDELKQLLSKTVSDGSLSATHNFEDLSSVDVAIVIVPLFLDKDDRADFTALDHVTEQVSTHIKYGAMVIYETTMPVGTVRKRFLKALRSDIDVGYSPERVYMGRVIEDLRRYPKLVGGVNAQSSNRIKSFYDIYFQKVVDMGSTENAEMAKLSEAVYRDVNIALSNSLATYAEDFGCDINRIIDACNTQPFSHLHRPGISIGGHCIPIYPYFLIPETDRTGGNLIKRARKVNEYMPFLALKRILSHLEKDSDELNFAILGLSFREQSKETANSGALKLAGYLKTLGVKSIYVHDPLFTIRELKRIGEPFNFEEKVDCVLLHTAHQEYRELSDESFKYTPEILFDGRSFLKKENFKRVKLIQIGVG